MVFDLGVRKDWENLAKPMVERLSKSFKIDVKKGVSEILQDGGLRLEEINSIIWRYVYTIWLTNISIIPQECDEFL